MEADLAHSNFGLCPPRPDLPGSEQETWVLDAMRCRQAWAVPPGTGGASRGEGIVIGHPDTGYTDHPELDRDALDLDRDSDFVAGDHDAIDPLETGGLSSPAHGTLTGCVIAGRDGGQIVGVAPRATLLPIRAIRSVVNVFDTSVARAVDYARQAGCHVVSMSLGGLFFTGLEEAINVAVGEGTIVMAAAGNCVGAVVWPALYPNCVAVAATNADDEPWPDSSRGPKVAISAPGAGVWAAGYDFDAWPPRPRVARHSGTSFAVAHLAGVAALWLAHHGREALIARYGLSGLQAAFLYLLAERGSRRPADWDAAAYGAGIVDAEALLCADLPDPSLVAAPTEIEHRLAARVRPDAIELMHQVCPELGVEQVREQLVSLFNARGAARDRIRNRYGAELPYLLSEDRAAREAFVRAARHQSPGLRRVMWVDRKRPPRAKKECPASSYPGGRVGDDAAVGSVRARVRPDR